MSIALMPTNDKNFEKKEGSYMPNEINKVLRIIRVIYGMTAAEMAKKLEMSPAYLSAIENGKRSVPDNFLEKAESNLGLDYEDKKSLRIATLKARKFLKINLENMEQAQKEMLYMFVQGNLDVSTIQELKDVLSKNKKEID